MNSYITLDGKKYATAAKTWTPVPSKPGSVRLNLNGQMDATYGAGVLLRWEGDILARMTPLSGYGSPADLRASLIKTQGLTFTDHYGTAYTVHVFRYKERSLSPNWDGATNEIKFQVELTGQAA